MARKIVVIAPGDFFPDYEAHHDGFRRFLPKGEPVEIEMRHAAPTWKNELAKGALLPGDEATAKWAGLKLPKAARKEG